MKKMKLNGKVYHRVKVFVQDKNMDDREEVLNTWTIYIPNFIVWLFGLKYRQLYVLRPGENVLGVNIVQTKITGQ